MELDKLDISTFLEKSLAIPVIDVRSPAEYSRGHIPGARNIPLLSNEERSVVGTLYLQKGSSEAIMKGLELIGPKMKQFAAEGIELAKGGELLIHCWRGGMRSNSMAWLFQTIGIRASTLTGGYKAYRRFVQESFNRPLNLVVIGGMTGSGKTAVIEELERKGHQIIHLERLSSHKGSVFGGIGLPDQPTTEQFENLLSAELLKMDPDKPVYTEDESLAIGRIFIPRSFYMQMSSARFVHLIVPVERRIQYLVEDYTSGNRDLLTAGIKRLERRLGPENANLAINLVNRGDMAKAVEIVLRYYDKIYTRSMSTHTRKQVIEIHVHEENTTEISERILCQRLN